jgi:dTMP kinase
MEQETEEFHQQIRQGYRRIAEDDPERYCLLKRSESIDETQSDVRDRVRERMSLREN